jgi:hypothetical protein
MAPMEEDLAARMKQSAARFRRTKSAYETARADLYSLIFDADEEDCGPSEIARASGFTREWVSKVIAAEKKRRGIGD